MKINSIALFCIGVIFFYSCNDQSGQPTQNTASNSASETIQLRDSMRMFPDDNTYPYRLALEFQRAQDLAAAKSIIDSVYPLPIIQQDSEARRFYWAKKAELEELTGDTSAAIATYEGGIRPGELSEPALKLLHLYAETLNSKTLDLSNAMKASDSAQQSPDVNYLTGLYYFNMGEYPKAIEEFDKSITKEYQYIDAHLEKGISYYEMKNYPEAMKALELALTISNSFPDGYYWKGKVEEATGKLQEARLDYLRAYGLDNSFKEAKEAADNIPPAAAK